MKAIQTKFLAENCYWLSGGAKQEFYLYLELNGAEAPVAANRVPLNISLVIDRSGSMSGDKVEYAKKAAQFVVDNLLPKDVVSVVQYDDVVEVLSPSTPVQHKAELRRRIEQITSRNTTNLSGGMLAGYDEVAKVKESGYVNRVLLLSDGLANEGITDPEMLKQLVQEKFRQAGIALSTFGIGADFNEILMTNLSEYGGGNYYFIDSPDKIPAIFAEELKGLLRIVAQNAVLEVALPAGLFRCEQVYGFPAEISEGRVRIRFNDLFAQEKKAVLLKLHALEVPAQPFSFGIALRYVSALDSYFEVEETTDLTIGLTESASSVQEGVNPEVLDQVTLFVANDMYEKAIQLANAGRRDQTKELVQHIKAYMEKHFQTMPASDELKKLYEVILSYEKQLEEMHTYSEYERKMYDKYAWSSSYVMKRKKW